MIRHSALTDSVLHALIRQKQVTLAGNCKLKLFGLLSCRSGKRMKRENRVFFVSEREARKMGYRPCAHCQPQAYRKWKDGLI